MPRFEPFPGIRFDTAQVRLANVTAPPYDVIDDDDRAALAATSPYNVVHVDCPRPEADEDCYQAAAERFEAWRRSGVLVDDQPSLYRYRMTFEDEAGRPRTTSGVIGALGLEPAGEGDVLPHEHTTPKARSDRLKLLQATAANLSAVWGLSLAGGLSALLDDHGDLIDGWTDGDGVGHTLWRISEPKVLDAVTATVASAPVVIADGHHRYETCRLYQSERRAEAGDAPGAYDLTMAFVVELSEDQLTVRPIHRLLSGLPDGFDLAAALEPYFEVDADAASDGLTLVTAGGRRSLRPRPHAFEPTLPDLDSSRLDVALADLPPHEVVYQHGAGNVIAAVEHGKAQAGVLLRPATVAQIARMAHVRERMPPKTTFFWPKVRSGLVFRSLR